MDESSKQLKSSEELARERTELAELRSDLAENRTLQAAERTYAAWIRTGFTIAGAGWTLGTALGNSESQNIALLLGGALVILGLMCFIYAWIGYKAVFDSIKKNFHSGDDNNDHSFTMNLSTVTILSAALFIIFVIGFSLLIF